MSNLQPDADDRIGARIAASQERLELNRPPLPAKDAYPPEDYRSLISEYPWLALAAGAGLGLLAGALTPKRKGGQLGKRLVGLAMVAGEIGLAASRQAGERAGEMGREGIAKAREGADQTRATIRSAGTVFTREAIKLAARVRK